MQLVKRSALEGRVVGKFDSVWIMVSCRDKLESLMIPLQLEGLERSEQHEITVPWNILMMRCWNSGKWQRVDFGNVVTGNPGMCLKFESSVFWDFFF